MISLKKINPIEEHTPALFLGLIATFSFLLARGALAVCLPLIVLFLLSQRKLFTAAIALIAFLWAALFSLPQTGEGLYEISIKQVQKTPFGFSYKVAIHRFQGNELSENNSKHFLLATSCRTFSKKRYPADRRYEIEGTLHKTANTAFLKSQSEWRQKEGSKNASLVEWRYELQKKVRAIIYDHCHYPDSRALLTALATGHLEDGWLRSLFAKCGLLHLLAISGFHFALIAWLLHLLLAPLFSDRIEALMIIASMTLYFAFLGPSPSVMRAWVAMLFFLFSRLVFRPASAANSLGAGLLVALIFDPLTSEELGFQLSFLATGALLLLAKRFTSFLNWIYPESSKTFWLERFFRKCLALNIAVHLTTAPLLLATFGALPLHSFLYNLFFPLLFIPIFIALALSLFFLLTLPTLGSWLMQITSSYCQLIIDLLAIGPLPHKTLYMAPLSSWVLSIYLTLLFGLALYRPSQALKTYHQEVN